MSLGGPEWPIFDFVVHNQHPRQDLNQLESMPANRHRRDHPGPEYDPRPLPTFPESAQKPWFNRRTPNFPLKYQDPSIQSLILVFNRIATDYRFVLVIANFQACVLVLNHSLPSQRLPQTRDTFVWALIWRLEHWIHSISIMSKILMESPFNLVIATNQCCFIVQNHFLPSYWAPTTRGMNVWGFIWV